MTLGERIRALHAGLQARRIPHAFGGAIALAYAVEEPRGTRDIDVNIFLPVADADRALSALPSGVEVSTAARAEVQRTGQVRLWWDDTPVDLFFSYAPVHDEADRHRRLVPFEGERIPILGPLELAIFKAMFDRMRDWGDLEEMAKAEMLDFEAVREALTEMVGADDVRIARLEEIRDRTERA